MGNYIGLNSTIPETTQVFPRTVVLDLPTLVKLKQDFNDGNNTMMGISLHALVLQASSLLNKNATSVVNKRELPPSGDIHEAWTRLKFYLLELFVNLLAF